MPGPGAPRGRRYVVISAAGTEWVARLKGFPHRLRDGLPTEVLLVDFADSFDARAAQDAQRRAEEYRRRGFVVAAAGPSKATSIIPPGRR